MPIHLDTEQPDFSARFTAFLGSKRKSAVDVQQQVGAIIADVRARGDKALVELSAPLTGWISMRLACV